MNLKSGRKMKMKSVDKTHEQNIMMKKSEKKLWKIKQKEKNAAY